MANLSIQGMESNRGIIGLFLLRLDSIKIGQWKALEIFILPLIMLLTFLFIVFCIVIKKEELKPK